MRPPSPNGRPNPLRRDNDAPPVLAFGDHMPAFLKQPVRRTAREQEVDGRHVAATPRLP